MHNTREFFKYVIPSIIAFALSGVYAIVDGFFVGNTIGDAGLSAINIAYPIVAVLQESAWAEQFTIRSIKLMGRRKRPGNLLQ